MSKIYFLILKMYVKNKFSNITVMSDERPTFSVYCY